MSTPTVAIIGRPNVGKSTLFNRIIGRRQAIVDAQPGVTRDRHFAPAEWNGRRFWLVDTGGLVPGSDDPMNRAIRGQVEQAIADSDVLLFVVDIESGIHPMDLEIAQSLRKARRPVLLVVNKADNLPDETRQLAFYELGLGDPFPVSAAVGKSSGDLLDRVVALLPHSSETEEDEAIHATRAIRSALHGFVTIEQAGGFALAVDLDQSFEWLVARLGDGLTASAPGPDRST